MNRALTLKWFAVLGRASLFYLLAPRDVSPQMPLYLGMTSAAVIIWTFDLLPAVIGRLYQHRAGMCADLSMRDPFHSRAFWTGTFPGDHWDPDGMRLCGKLYYAADFRTGCCPYFSGAASGVSVWSTGTDGGDA